MNAANKSRRRKTSVETNMSAFMERANKIESQRLQKQLKSMETASHKNMVYLFRRRLSAQDVLACLQRQEGGSCLVDRKNLTSPQEQSSGEERNEGDVLERKSVSGHKSEGNSEASKIFNITKEAGVFGDCDVKPCADNILEDCLQNLNISSSKPYANSPTQKIRLSTGTTSGHARPKSAPLRWQHNTEKIVTSSADDVIKPSAKQTDDTFIRRGPAISQKDKLQTHSVDPSNTETSITPMHVARGIRPFKQTSDMTIEAEFISRRPVRRSATTSVQHFYDDTQSSLNTIDDQAAVNTNHFQGVIQDTHFIKIDSQRQQQHKPRLLSRAEKLGLRPFPQTPVFPQRRPRASTNANSLTIDTLPISSPSSPQTCRKTTMPRVRKLSAMTQAEFMNDSIRSKAYGLDTPDLHSINRENPVPVLLPLRPHTAGGARKLQRALATTDQNLDRRLQAFLKQPMPGEIQHEENMF